MEKIEKQAAEARENVAEETQSGTEPVSGETGAGTKEQPYDAGNAPGRSCPLISGITCLCAYPVLTLRRRTTFF